MEARRHRARRGRAVGAGDGAVQCLAGAAHYFPGHGLADRRRRRRTLARRTGGCDGRLVVRPRLFRAGTVLDRICVPGRCIHLRMVDAVRRARPAGLSCAVHRLRFRAGAADLDQGCLAGDRACRSPDAERMAARSCADRLSVECIRLRPDRTAGAGADRLTDRPVGSHLSQRGYLCEPSGPDRWKFTRTKTLDRTGAGAAAAGRDGHFRHRSPDAASHHHGCQRQAAHHAAQPAAGREIQLRRQGGGNAKISDALRSAVRTAIHRRARRQHPDLAGIGVPVFPDARRRRHGPDRRSLAQGHRADHRSGARARSAARDADHTRLQFDLRHRSRWQRVVGLRQAASGAVRRISAVSGFDGKTRLRAAHQGPGRLHSGRATPHHGDTECAARATFDLL